MEKIKVDIVVPGIPLEMDSKALEAILENSPIDICKLLINKINQNIDSSESPYVTCITDKDGEIIYEY